MKKSNQNIITMSSFVLTLMSSSSLWAQNCAVPPTCESLGYTESAENCQNKKTLKCPFDNSKVFCLAPEDALPKYKKGDTYMLNGQAIGQVISLTDEDDDGYGTHGTIISIQTYSGTLEEAIAGCASKTSGNLEWSLPTYSEMRASDKNGQITAGGRCFTRNTYAESRLACDEYGNTGCSIEVYYKKECPEGTKFRYNCVSGF